MQFKLIIPLAFFTFLFSAGLTAQCTGSGSIDVSFGNPTTLDPDGDGDIVEGGSVFSACSGEVAEFEQVTNPSGCSTCQVPWTSLGIQEPNNDLWSGGGCGNTDIVTDQDGGNDFAYFSIVDPDGSCNNGDELLVFRLRISNNFSGNFGFDFLISNDGLMGNNDPDGVPCCTKIANPGFEFEVQLKTGSGGAGVNIYDIDGLVGTDNCPGNSPCITYPLSSHAQKATACGSECACRAAAPAGDPIFLTFMVPLTDLGVDCSTYNLLNLVPVSSTSGNAVIASCTSVSDVGGIGLNTNIIAECPSCDGVSYAGCNAAQSLEACGIMCAAENNSFANALPVDMVAFTATAKEGHNQINWTIASEINTEWFIVERSANGVNDWKEIGRVAAKGFSYSLNYYFLKDNDPLSHSYYRLRSVDYDQSIQLSYTISVYQENLAFKLYKTYPTITRDKVEILLHSPSSQPASIRLYDIRGHLILQKSIQLSKGTNNEYLDIRSMPDGLITIQIAAGGQQTLSSRIVKFSH